MLRHTEQYAAVRRTANEDDNTSYEWIDGSTFSGSIEGVKDRVRETATKIPDWDAANQVVRVALFRLIEIRQR